MGYRSMSQLQPGDLGAAHAGAVEKHQQRPLEEAVAGNDQTSENYEAEDLGEITSAV